MPDLADYHLRAMQARDRDTVLAWRNQPHIRACMFSDDIITEQQHQQWFQATLARNDVDYRILEYRQQPVGLANAVNFNNDNKSCHWGFYLGEPDLPKGSGSAMAMLMLQHLFDSYDIDTVFSEVFAFNTASLRLHEKFGFTLLESSRTVRKNGNDETVLQLALHRQQWHQLKDRIAQGMRRR